MQSGEIIVTGQNSVQIPLNGMPSEIKAHFKDEIVLAPCDPHNADTLEYEVSVSNTVRGGLVLVISWNVSSVREVVWHAYY